MTKIAKATQPSNPAGRSREDTAHRLGDVHLRTVDRLLRAKKLRGYRVGRRVFVFDDSIDEYLAAQTVF
jgi:excisionase family DNA binding protein